MIPPRNSETPPPAERTVDRAARAFFAAVLGFVLWETAAVIFGLVNVWFSPKVAGDVSSTCQSPAAVRLTVTSCRIPSGST